MNSKLVKYLSIAMAIFYMAFGFFMVFTDFLKQRVPNNRLVIGGVFLGYGIFRLVKIILDIRKLNRQKRGFFDIEN